MIDPDDRPELRALEEAYDAADLDAQAVVAGISPELGAWRTDPGSWSIAECLDHLATANRVYLQAMRPPAERALEQGRRRRQPALPGVIGGWFVNTLEPRATPAHKRKAPRKIRPRTAPPVHDALAQFLASKQDVRAFLRRYADIDLASVRFPNPFVRGIRFSLATGLHVIAAHDRRHLAQAWRVRKAAEQAIAAA